MSDLPRIIQRSPFIFYGLALLFFVASWFITLSEVNTAMAYADPGNPVATNAKMRGLYQAAVDAVFIAANGVMAHIFLGIWKRLAIGRPELSHD